MIKIKKKRKTSACFFRIKNLNCKYKDTKGVYNQMIVKQSSFISKVHGKNKQNPLETIMYIT